MPATHETHLPPRYRDVEPIAEGGMGEIFRATDSELGREVAIKVLSRRFANEDSSRARFEREALAAARLSGARNIVTIFDVAEHDGRPLIVMEYLPGGSLEQRIAGAKPCELGQSLDWLDDAARALDAAHAAGVVHRDVKPANLLLDAQDHVYVADFGIASAVGLESFTQVGTILGTAGYLSPEQAKGERATPASDRYGLAVVAWELLTGKRPFESSSPTAEAAAHAHTPVPDIRAGSPSLPPAYSAIFARALAKDPAARYPTAAEFVGDLRRASHDDAGTTRITTFTPPPRRWWLGALAAILIAGGVLAAVLASRGGHHPPRPVTVVHTVTGPGTTVQETVTAQQPTTTAAPPTSPASGAALNNAGYAKMQQRDFAGALPLLEQAVQKLSGTGSIDEAYADYNLAFTRLALGQCTDVLSLLDHSQQIQGHRKEIDQLRKDASKRC